MEIAPFQTYNFSGFDRLNDFDNYDRIRLPIIQFQF